MATLSTKPPIAASATIGLVKRGQLPPLPQIQGINVNLDSVPANTMATELKPKRVRSKKRKELSAKTPESLLLDQSLACVLDTQINTVKTKKPHRTKSSRKNNALEITAVLKDRLNTIVGSSSDKSVTIPANSPSGTNPAQCDKPIFITAETLKVQSPVSMFEHLKLDLQDFRGKTLNIEIQRADSLTSHFWLKHPLVQVTIINLQTGEYLLKSEPQRPAIRSTEAVHIDYILPAITKPYDLRDNNTKTPIWNDKIIVNEEYLHIVSRDIIVIFEILDFVTVVKKSKDPWHRVCWGFLKLVSEDGKANTENQARLQMFKYPKYMPADQERSPGIYRYWQMQTRLKYPSTLFVKIKASGLIKPAESPSSGESNDSERPGAFHDIITGYMKKRKPEANIYRSIHDLIKAPDWERKPGNKCIPPNKIMYQIDTPNGAFCCAFSNNGFFLAIACVAPQHSSNLIKIYDVLTGDRLTTMEGHIDLIYQLTWSSNDLELLSCSSDGTARIWIVDSSHTDCKILHHPAFVYAVIYQCHQDESKVVTGCYDGFIRIWDKNTEKCVYKLSGHATHVNAICFNIQGNRMYSGDASGLIKIWAEVDNEGKFECIRTIDSFNSNIRSLTFNTDGKLMVQTAGKLMMMDCRVDKFVTTFQAGSNHRQTSFFKAELSACGSWVYMASGEDVEFWRSETGLLSGIFSKETLKSWNSKGNVVSIAAHPFDNIIAFCRLGNKQSVDLYRWDKDTNPIGTKKMINENTSNIGISEAVKKGILGLQDKVGTRSA